MVKPLPFLKDMMEAGYAMAVTQAIYFVVSFVVLYLLGRIFVIPVVKRLLDRQGYDESVKIPLTKVTQFAVLFAAVGIAFALADYGNILTALATIAAAATLAVGFALQDIIANFVAGVFIFTDKPFKIGDWIEWDGDSYSGIVEDIDLRVTRIRTFDNELLTVPNSVLTDGVIKNPVAKDKLRVQFLFGIGYDDDIHRATEIILEEAQKHDEILDDPEPSVRLTELGDSSVGLKSRFWISDPKRSDFVKTRGEYVTAVKERFDAEGIDIPYPYRNLAGGIEISNPSELAVLSED
ncbi:MULTISPECIES: mechanosensitive ion channel family protein [unclassified Haladaptatus]|uniref:mechanosensitive ion channel family protein n=1 Tax=unclassified Haladaptatus TaxID=2622732 RepID=UPI00209C24CF|nr:MULTISPECIES: mechanosensitive ion channel family protein [unclassified Haladaptatus]MCO8245947.1 mechanosensitive ion channel family protein [Haladaptatus sp. AB643]MCO8254433.1 mechanosensitive ion channel family protein [Haladaptatus sp. AB618]